MALLNRKYYQEKYEKAILNMKRDSNRVLIEIAAQHPLIDSLYPNDEFKARLDMGIYLYHKLLKEGYDVIIYVPGSLHKNPDGLISKVSLSDAGCSYLIKNGLPREILRGNEYNSKYDKERAYPGVYNSADECFIASKIFNDKKENFSKLICICSPNQSIRKTLFYIDNEVIPLVYTVPVLNSFHNVIGEVYDCIPYVLEVDHNQQELGSKEAIRTRNERMVKWLK